MLCKTEHGLDLYIGQFACVIKTPSGHAGINFEPGLSAYFSMKTVILDLTFDEFVSEWNRQHPY